MNFGPKFFSKNDPIGGNSMREIDCAHFPIRENACLTLVQEKNAKNDHFSFKNPIFP
jgi:hypothetical protein